MTDKTGTTKDEAAARGAGDESAQPAGHAEVERAEVEIDKMSVTEIHKKLEEALASLEEKQKALEEKEREAAEYKDKYLRALAESENARKRIRQQAEESARIQREGLLRDLLAIIDNLERAVAAARGGGNGKPIVEGVEMVLRSMVDFLRGHGVTQLSAVGQPFDPLLHEAVDHVESAQHEPNTVVDEFVRGYYIGDRLLRPARVTVSKLPPPSGERGSGAGGGGHVENQ
jgi:molecular chaperone GrpE